MFDTIHRGIAPPQQNPMTINNPRVAALVNAIRSGRAPQNPGMIPNEAMQRMQGQLAPSKPAMLDNSLDARMRAMNELGQRERVMPVGQRPMAPGAGMASPTRMPPVGQIPPQVRARLMALQRGNPV